MSDILVLGIGNSLLSDEGVGVHAVSYLREHHPPPPGCSYLDGGTLSFTLASYIEEAENLIVIDAAELGEPPGTTRCLVGSAMDTFLGSRKLSVHEVSLIDLLQIAQLAGHLPRKRALVGVQPGCVGWGESLSTEVRQALPRVANEVWLLLQKWVKKPPQS